ncbi:MAG: PLP-dependent aminotransferase family protein [Ilumatobacteraceae bacterium]
MIELICQHVDDRSARGIAATIGRLVSTGEMSVGDRLPTVRQLSRRLGVSPTTVGEAWRTLAEIGAIETLGRNGSYVRQPTGPGSPRRYRRLVADPDDRGHFRIDLSTGTPDAALLPVLGPALANVSGRSLTSTYLDHAVLPDLEKALRDSWPFDPEELTVVDGALDALDRIAQVVVRLGDRVVVEHPTFPPLLDLLDRLGAVVIGVPLDDEGMQLDELERALATSPTALFLQPRAHNPTGVTMTSSRAQEIARVVAASPNGDQVVVVEDDHSGDIAIGEPVSIGRHLPRRTVHIRSFSKSHGPDLRLAAVAGTGEVISAASNRRMLGPGWSSRILQAVLVELLADDTTLRALEHARHEYAERRRRVVEILSSSGVTTTGSDGINLWVHVIDERAALVSLAAQGIGAAPGEPFMVDEHPPAMRLTVGLLGPSADLDGTAEMIASAASTSGESRRGQR